MSYVIPDEPTPSTLTRFAVRPDAPLLAAITAGAWLAWPWFAFNGFAFGSPTRHREAALCGAALAGTAVLAMILLALMNAGIIVTPTALNIASLAITAFKMAMAYYISNVQGRTFAVYEYYGGTVKRSWAILAFGSSMRVAVIMLIDDPIWRIIVSGGVL